MSASTYTIAYLLISFPHPQTATINLNFFISLGVSGIINTIFESELRFKHHIGIFLAALTIGFYILYVVENGVPPGSMIGGSVTSDGGKSLKGTFTLGLIAG